MCVGLEEVLESLAIEGLKSLDGVEPATESGPRGERHWLRLFHKPQVTSSPHTNNLAPSIVHAVNIRTNGNNEFACQFGDGLSFWLPRWNRPSADAHEHQATSAKRSPSPPGLNPHRIPDLLLFASSYVSPIRISIVIRTSPLHADQRTRPPISAFLCCCHATPHPSRRQSTMSGHNRINSADERKRSTQANSSISFVYAEYF